MYKNKLFLLNAFIFLSICFVINLSTYAADRGMINSGETKVGLQLVAPSYMDTWTFYGNDGDRVIITAVTTSGVANTQIYLYPPDSGPSEADTYPWGDKLDHQLQQTGLYTILIEDYGLNEAGCYNVSLTKIPSTLRPGIYNPYPANGDTICDLYGSFSWDPVAGATGYDLYFGEDVVEPLVKIGDNLPSQTMQFPVMEAGKIYYWHVVAHTTSGDIIGPVWWFYVKDQCTLTVTINKHSKHR